ncbi:MAG: hypothetical protein WA667_21580 [Candidatus Nitrosopolaris sp.]
MDDEIYGRQQMSDIMQNGALLQFSKKLNSSAIKRIIERTLWEQGIRTQAKQLKEYKKGKVFANFTKIVQNRL